MAGMFLLPDDRDWQAGSSVFYWVLDRLAEDASESLAARLELISSNNLGALDVGDLEPAELVEFRRLVGALADIAPRELPDTEHREPIALMLEELAAMIEHSLKGSPVPPRACAR